MQYLGFVKRIQSLIVNCIFIYSFVVDYGGLGTVIGHEISHGFDPHGAKFNYNGTEVEIWTHATKEIYNDKIQCFVDQYDSLSVDSSSGIEVNGSTTITENVADNSGITASFTAWKNRAGQHQKDQKLPGVDMTNEQLFFWSWSHVWCEAARVEYYNDWRNVHSPHPARVWGAVQNSPEFSKAYHCQPDSAMNPTRKCILW